MWLKVDTLESSDPGDGCPGRKGPKISREVECFRGEKKTFNANTYGLSVPKTDTGGWEENSKANGRRVVKELGKMTP